MRSLADHRRVRVVLEHIFHATALLAVLALAWRSLHPRLDVTPVRVAQRDLRDALRRATSATPGQDMHLVLDAVPAPFERDWLAAIARAGTRVSWQSDSIRATAISIEPVTDPARPFVINIAAESGSRVSLNDGASYNDTVTVAHHMSATSVSAVSGVVRAIQQGTIATAARHDSIAVRPLLVLGSAGWETKFIVAALEEHGWTVDVRLGVSPTGDLGQGKAIGIGAPITEPAPDTTPAGAAVMRLRKAQAARAAQIRKLRSRTVARDVAFTIDTARYAAVIVTDTAVTRYSAQLREYVRSGGGLIVTADAAASTAVTQLLPGRLSVTRPELVPFDSASPLRSLALSAITALDPLAVILDRDGMTNAVVAWRVGSGRVVLSGYHDTWRWRMAGADKSVDAHRTWWSRLTAAVAYSPAFVTAADVSDPMPLAALVDRLGPPTRNDSAAQAAAPDSRPLLFAIAITAALMQWMSRRLRGAP